VNDPRVAEQLSVVVIIPVLLLFFGQVSGLLLLNNTIIILMAAAVFLVDLILIQLSIRIFQRETILTRWK
jgi:ABC-2 type transport system permease protein